jgi:hypothetical protein
VRDAELTREAMTAWVEGQPAVVAARRAYDAARTSLVAFTARTPNPGEGAADFFLAHRAAREGAENAYEAAQQALDDARRAAGRAFRHELAAAGTK